MSRTPRTFRAQLAPTAAMILMTTGCTIHAFTPVTAHLPVHASTLSATTDASQTVVAPEPPRMQPSRPRPVEQAFGHYTLDGRLAPAEAAKVDHVSLSFIDDTEVTTPVDAEGHFKFSVQAAQSEKAKHMARLIFVMKDRSQLMAFFPDENGHRLAFIPLETGKQYHLGQCSLEPSAIAALEEPGTTAE